MPCKEEWAEAWCCYIPDFRQSVTSCVEGLHAKLKSYLQVSKGHLFDILNNIKGLITNEMHQHESCLACAHTRPHQEHHLVPEFKHLLHKVSPEGLQLLHQQLRLVKDPHHNTACTGSFTIKYGFPCVHMLKPRLHAVHGGVAQIELSEIHSHWHFQRLCKWASPPDELLWIEDPATVCGKGWPKGATSWELPSTTRNPSAFELAESSQRIITTGQHGCHVQRAE